MTKISKFFFGIGLAAVIVFSSVSVDAFASEMKQTKLEANSTIKSGTYYLSNVEYEKVVQIDNRPLAKIRNYDKIGI